MFRRKEKLQNNCNSNRMLDEKDATTRKKKKMCDLVKRRIARRLLLQKKYKRNGDTYAQRKWQVHPPHYSSHSAQNALNVQADGDRNKLRGWEGNCSTKKVFFL